MYNDPSSEATLEDLIMNSDLTGVQLLDAGLFLVDETLVYQLDVDLDPDSEDEDEDFVGTFYGERYEVIFRGPTADDVIGRAYRYATKLTDGDFRLNVTTDETVIETLEPLP